MRYRQKSCERGRMKNAKTQSLSGFKANPSFYITFLIRDAFPGEAE